jgi:predicted amidophosphoribosyltransferase
VWHPSGVDGIRVLGRYERAAGRLVRGLKFANRRTPVAALAVALADIGPDPAPTVVTWVPSTVRRRSRRGVEHTALLARAVARRLGVPARRLLLRAPGRAQSERDLVSRRRGPRLRARRVPAGAAVLVVDDVVTTGTSLATAASALRRAGATRVTAVAVAAAAPDGGRRRHAAATTG